MKMFLPCLSAALALASLGCGSDEYGAAIEDQLKAQQELVSILKGINDTAGMEAAYETLKKNYKALSETATRTQNLRPPSAETQKRLKKAYGARWQAILQELQSETWRVGKLPGGTEFFKKVDQIKRDTPEFSP